MSDEVTPPMEENATPPHEPETAVPGKPRILRGSMTTTGPLAEARMRLLRKIEPPEPADAVPLPSHRISPRARQDLYLEAYRNSNNVRASALKAGVSRMTVLRWRQRSKWFVQQEQLAELDYLDALRAQIDTRSRDSDAVLMMRAKSRLPEYKETVRQEHVAGDSGLPVRFTLQIGDAGPEDEPTTTEIPVTGTNGHPAP